MKKTFLLAVFAFGLFSHITNAQIIKGDMNDDGVMDISDVSESVNTLIGKRAIQYITGGVDPYMVDNSRVVGTWYKTKNEHFTLNADGTTDYYGAATYEFLPYQGIILFYNASGTPITKINVDMLKDGYMVCVPMRTGILTVFTTEVPHQPVTAIQLSATSLEMSVGEFKQISALVLPEDADNKAVTWESSNESVARLSGDLILAMADGTAVITCKATDGSSVKAECIVTVCKIHEYVDLGLPGGVLWATYNVGAEKPEDYGLYFAWGEAKGYAKGESHVFDWAHYKWCNGNLSSMTKYCTSTDYGIVDNKTVLDPEDDAATANWGAFWRMPTKKEQDDLRNTNYCTWTWKTRNGVKGYEVTSKSNGNSIFLPAAGYRMDSSHIWEGTEGEFWSQELSTAASFDTYMLYFQYHASGQVDIDWGGAHRCSGRSVRAVRAK